MCWACTCYCCARLSLCDRSLSSASFRLSCVFVVVVGVSEVVVIRLGGSHQACLPERTRKLLTGLSTMKSIRLIGLNACYSLGLTTNPKERATQHYRWQPKPPRDHRSSTAVEPRSHGWRKKKRRKEEKQKHLQVSWKLQDFTSRRKCRKVELVGKRETSKKSGKWSSEE